MARLLIQPAAPESPPGARHAAQRPTAPAPPQQHGRVLSHAEIVKAFL